MRGGRARHEGLADTLRSVPPRVYALIICTLAIVLVVPAAASHNAAQAEDAAAQAEAAQRDAKAKKKPKSEAEQLEDLDFEISAASFDAIPTDEDLMRFSLSALKDPKVPQEELDVVGAAIDAIEAKGGVSVVFVDTRTGRGLSYRPDLMLYGASSFKAPYSLYVCRQFIETGATSLDSYCMVNSSIGPDGYAAGSSYTIASLIEGAITQSSNNAYGALRNAFDFQGYDEWVTALGVPEAVYRADSWFPTYCARSSARLWAEMLDYFSSGTDTALWLSDLTGKTSVSFIRDGLEGTGATVRDKAGWCTDSDPAYNSVSDAGIVEVDGGVYIMSILTGMPDSEANRALVGDLARALLDCREALGVEDSAED